MANVASSSKLVWLLPIVLGICALMVLPGGTVLGSSAVSSLTLSPAGGHSAQAAGPSVDLATSSVPLTSARATPATILSGLPSSLDRVPWIQSLTHTGPATRPLTSLPNLAILKDPPTANGQPVNPFYVAQPAPLGVGDFGLGATTYSYNVSRFLGQVTLQAPPNVTDPGSAGLVEPSGQADGNVGSMYEFGVQLNTVATNISIPGSDQGFFWTQNVVNWNDTGIHFVDDTFNLTSATQDPFYIAPGTIFSACHLNAAGVDQVLVTYGGVFQCVGGTIPVSPASYPVTLQLINTASVNAQGRTQVTYGYRISEAGTGLTFTGVASSVVFNNPAAPTTPANKPGFTVDGWAPTPVGLFRDAEIVLVGDIGGDNSVFRSINGSVNLDYSNASSGGFRSVPSAYNFGGDTGETSTGIADYWTPSHTLEINQGPAMLYGLWNAAPWASVHSGDIHFGGSISPNYGFVFVSNTHAILDPWGTGARDNMSWLPTTNAGTFSTYLPPVGAPWTSRYFVQAFAAGYAEKNGSTFNKSTSVYNLHLTAAPGSLNAPLYAFSNAQASGLALAVTGSAAPPYDFNNLVVNMNFTFDHVNDYGYPTFVVLMTQGVTNPVYVNNTYEGSDSAGGNFFIYPFAPSGSTGILVPAPATSTSVPFFTSGINIFGGVNDRITNQTAAAEGYGLQIVLWGDSNAWVSNINSLYRGAGVWVGDSSWTTVTDVVATTGGTGITDIGSTHTTGSAIEVVGFGSLGVEGLTASFGTFSDILATDGGTGVSTGADYGASAAYDSYYYLPGTTGMTVTGLLAANDSLGANLTLSQGSTFSDVYVVIDSDGVVTDNAPMTAISQVTAVDHSTGVWLFNSRHVDVSAVAAWKHSEGVIVSDSKQVHVAWVSAWKHSTGVIVLDSTMVSISHVFASHYSLGVYVDALSTKVTISFVTAVDHSTGVLII
ncbi:MAG: thermopsin [Thermoplasmata archaeon]|nr:thermopsin [Thermoplasmata archaeon]